MSGDPKGLDILLGASSIKEDEEKTVHATEPAVDKPAGVMLPPELLDEILRPQFAWMGDLRGRLRLATTLGLVCKAFKLCAETIAWEDVDLDVSDLDALAYLDPNGGPGRHVLPYIQTLQVEFSHFCLSWMAFSNEASDDGSIAANASIQAEAVDKGPFNPEAVMEMSRGKYHARIIACGASIIASCSNILKLFSEVTVAPILAGVCSEHELPNIWPRLLKLDTSWSDPICFLVPIISRVSQFDSLKSLNIHVWGSATDPHLEGNTVADLVTRYPIKSMTSLEHFSLAATPGYSVHHPFFSPLLATNSRLKDVSWTGAVPPDFCAKMAGCTKIEFWLMTPQGDLAGSLLPQLPDLRHAPVDGLLIRPSLKTNNKFDTQTNMPSVQVLFDSLPYSVKITSLAGDCFGSALSFPYDTAMSAAMQHPLATIQLLCQESRFAGTYQKKPLVQVVYIRVSGYDDSRYFGRFGNPDKDGDVTDWLPLKVEDDKDA